MSSTVDLPEETLPAPPAAEVSPYAASENLLEAPPTAVPSHKWFYGWLMLPLAALIMIATSPGQTFGISHFNPKLREAFGLSSTYLASIYLAATVTAAFALPSIGSLIDRFKLRRSTIAAVAAMAIVCALVSQVTGVVTLFVAFLLLRMLGPGTMVLLANNTLAEWFDRRLGMASGAMQLAMAGAFAVIPTVMIELIESFGWRGAYLALGGIMACGLLPLLIIYYRQSPRDVGQMPDGEKLPKDETAEAMAAAEWSFFLTVKQAVRERSYWILIAATGLWAMIGTGIIFHLSDIVTSYGATVETAKMLMVYLAIGMATMQIIGGYLADRIPARWLVFSAVGMMAVSCGLLASGNGDLLFASYIVYGLSQGLMTIISGTVWARYFGRAHLGKIRGTSLTAAVGASSVGPLIMSISDDYLGGFNPSMWLLTGLAAAIALAGIWATPPKQPAR